MKNVFFLFSVFLLFLSYTGVEAQGTGITVSNPTRFNVYFDQNQQVRKNANGNITLFIESGTLSRGFDIWYEIPLSSTVNIFCKGDHRTIRENQTSLTVTEPQITESYGTFLVIHNKADGAITFNTGGTVNPLVEQRGSPAGGNYLARTDKREFSPGETAVFDISADSGRENYTVRESRKTTAMALEQPLQRNHVYTYEYSAGGIELIDSRPLHRAGESAWAKTISSAAGFMPVTVTDTEIHLFAPESRNIIRYVYDCAGNAKAQVTSGDSFRITFAANTEDGFFISGYERPANGDYRPAARLLREDGQTQRVLDYSGEYNSARFWTAAKKDDNTWLLAGDESKNGDFNNNASAYARMVRNENGSLKTIWELGGKDFTVTGSEIKCGEIKSAAYDHTGNCWIVTGENIESDSMKNPVMGSYIARINNDGTIQKTDASFKGVLFHKIIVDTDGGCYLAGEEQKENETYAVLIKYNADGRQLWKLADQPASNSYYYDAVFDYANNRIVLAGTLEAINETGQGGIPFIEAADMAQGTLLWREKLSASALNAASLVTTVEAAPDYGFVLTLSGINRDGAVSTPYIIARVNSQGKYLEEIR